MASTNWTPQSSVSTNWAPQSSISTSWGLTDPNSLYALLLEDGTFALLCENDNGIGIETEL